MCDAAALKGLFWVAFLWRGLLCLQVASGNVMVRLGKVGCVIIVLDIRKK